ncbi:hypothetical protein HanIR_Chr02g0095771 [Helianthus annuus]|uniref:Uncharacterized protein n=1 Tax=Helianthus annuus TaxID=4232 RepID=A0A251VMQ4_HELAN|nr:hypothetical protein HanIR_Chr02g0095771 [Helianthus annuus]
MGFFVLDLFAAPTQKCRSYGFRNDVFRFVPLLKLGFLFSCRAYCVQTIVNLHRT